MIRKFLALRFSTSNYIKQFSEYFGVHSILLCLNKPLQRQKRGVIEKWESGSSKVWRELGKPFICGVENAVTHSATFVVWISNKHIHISRTKLFLYIVYFIVDSRVDPGGAAKWTPTLGYFVYNNRTGGLVLQLYVICG